MKTLKDYSIEELKLALKIKEQEKIPEIIPNPDFTNLINMSKEYINDLANGRFNEGDTHYFYEELMTTLFGKDIFTWINKRI